MDAEAKESSPKSGEQYEIAISGDTDVRNFAQNLSYSSEWHGKTEGLLRRWERADAYGTVRFTDIDGEEKLGYVSRWAPNGQVMYIDVPDPNDSDKLIPKILDADYKIRYAVYKRATPTASEA